MHRISFIFIASAFLTLPLAEIQDPLYQQIELLVCLGLIASFGIAHGAIDNHLYGFKNMKGNFKFIAVYVVVALAFALLWLIASNIAFLIFMLISAYHFGQSQLVEETEDQSIWPRIIYTIWGLWLLSSFLYLNEAELRLISASDLEILPSFGWLLDHSYGFFLSSSLLLLGSLIWAVGMGLIRWSSFFMEMYQALMILVVFYISSTLWGFTLYFVVLHSGRVLQQEYAYLISSQRIHNLLQFTKLLSPFTILSLLGLVSIIFGLYFFELSISYSLLALIFISCLTVPHSWVMDRFYQKSI